MKSTLAAVVFCSLIWVPHLRAETEFRYSYRQYQTSPDTLEDIIVEQVNKLPLSTRPIPALSFEVGLAEPDGLNSLDQIQVQAQLQAKRNISDLRVQLFPVLSYKTKQFPYAEGGSRGARPSDPYAVTPNLGKVELVSIKGALHLSKMNGQILGDGKVLTFNLAKNSFSLDGKTSTIGNGIRVIEDQDELTCVRWWSTLRGFDKAMAIDRKMNKIVSPCFGERGRTKEEVAKNVVGFPYHGSFEVTVERTPRGAPAIQVINVVDYIHYTGDVIPIELGFNDIPQIANEGQALAAQTYAFNITDTFEKVFPGSQHQVYEGALHETQDTLAAAQKVHGKALVFNGHLINAMYHSCSGGQTVAFSDYASKSGRRMNVAYLKSIHELDPKAIREDCTHLFNIDMQSFITAIRSVGGSFRDSQVVEIAPASVNSSGRTTSLKVRGPTGQIVLSPSQFLSLRQRLRLHDYIGRAVIQGSKVVIPTFGNGHGVGLSQEGLIHMARLAEEAQSKGKSIPEDIYINYAKMYFSGAEVVDFQGPSKL